VRQRKESFLLISRTGKRMSGDLRTTFHEKYDEFVSDLKGALPELTSSLDSALLLSHDERLKRFSEEVLPNASPSRDVKVNPGVVLPGVQITDELWASLSDGSRKAIQEYLTLLGFCYLYTNMKSSFDISGNPTQEWSENFLKDWKEKMGSMDFAGMSKKLADLIGNLTPDKMPKIPERLLKGHLARLAEDLVKEFKPEDFGLSTEELKACDSDPARAFTLLTDIYTKKPDILQKAIQRIAGRLQDKVRRGELRPEQIAAEAEELMKEFAGNSSFVELMESFRSTFGMEDPDLARTVGREGEARRNIVKDRLRKKLEARKAGKK
jgi:hypothetical protein